MKDALVPLLVPEVELCLAAVKDNLFGMVLIILGKNRMDYVIIFSELFFALWVEKRELLFIVDSFISRSSYRSRSRSSFNFFRLMSFFFEVLLNIGELVFVHAHVCHAVHTTPKGCAVSF